jgi:hypothetical protein
VSNGRTKHALTQKQKREGAIKTQNDQNNKQKQNKTNKIK